VLNQTGSTANGNIDGPLDCDIEGVGEFSDQVVGPGEGIQVNGDNISWSQDNCTFAGEVQTADRIDGTLSCATTLLGSPVTVQGSWQMDQ
jgi:hypothetical protein